jgi:KTSC domain-containing protein
VDRLAVRSSNIRSIGYDEALMTLEVEFKTGSIYQYLAVPKSVLDRFMLAPSKGRFFDLYIRERFRTVRIR